MEVKNLIEHDDGSTTGVITPERSLNRLTIVEAVHHRNGSGEPFTVESRFPVNLTTDEQPYVRKAFCGTKWQQLDFGWITECSMFIIRNHGAEGRQVIPTKEEADEDAKKILRVAYVDKRGKPKHSPWLIRPGTTIRLSPGSLENLCIKAKTGRINYTLYAFPI